VLQDTVLGEISVTEFAKKLGVSRATLSRVVNGRAAVSADMALGGSGESWLRMQRPMISGTPQNATNRRCSR
jgi:addiction module HigA family antidote